MHLSGTHLNNETNLRLCVLELAVSGECKRRASGQLGVLMAHPASFKRSPLDMILEMLISEFSCHCPLVTGTSKADRVRRGSISVVECFP